MTFELMRVKEIFLAALDELEPEARLRYLREACGEDAALLAQVKELLAVHEQAGTFLDASVLVAAADDSLAAQAVTPNLGVGDTRTEARRAEYGFLSPPQGPDELGRLGPNRVCRLLGQGGMGLVFEAEDPQLQRRVAIKLMRPEAEQRPGARERFLREARAAAAVRHENVVTIHHVDETEEVPFLVMEFLEGQSLETRCRTGPPLTMTEIVRIGREVAAGLAAAHKQGLTHRDIKPDNIWLETRGEGRETSGADSQKLSAPGPSPLAPRVKLLDFGLARGADADVRITQNSLIVGTPAYMAPEQASAEPVDGRTDLFSLGCVLYRLIAGQPPFNGPNPLAILKALATETPRPLRELDPQVPESLSRLITSLLARRPEDRPASAQAVVETLTAIEHELQKKDGKAVRRPLRDPRLRVGLPALALAAVLVAVVVLRVQTQLGEIVIETNDPNVAVLFEQGKVQLHDRKTGKKYSLAVGAQKQPSGEYQLEVTDEAAGLTFSTSRFTLQANEQVLVQASFVARKNPPALAQAAPADAFKRADIPDDLLKQAGGGDAAKAPPELVAVLGGARHFPVARSFKHHVYTRYSPDGRSIATCANREVWVYDADTGRILQRLPHAKPCFWFDYRPDSKVLAVCASDGIALWDIGAGKSLGQLTDETALPRWLSYAADGKSLVTTDADGKARLWDVHSKKIVQTFAPPTGQRYTQAPQIHPDGRLVALQLAEPASIVQVLDLAAGDIKVELPGAGSVNGAPGLDYQTTMRFSPDGKLFACVRGLKETCLWEVGSWKSAGAIAGNASIVSFSASGTLFRAHVWNGSGAGGTPALINDAGTHGLMANYRLPVAGQLTWSDLSPNGRTIAVRPANTNCIRIFDAATGAEQLPIDGHRGSVIALAVSSDGCAAASIGADQRALVWDLAAGKVSRELVFLSAVNQGLDAVAFSPDAKWVAVLKQNGGPSWLRIWDMATGKEVGKLLNIANDVHRPDFTFHPNGRSLIASSQNRLVTWTLPNGPSKTWEEGHEKPIETLAIHPGGAQVASADKDGVICLWNSGTGKRLRWFHCGGEVLRVRFSPDGEMLAATTAAPDAALYLFDLQTGAKVRRAASKSDVCGLAWQPDSQAAALACADGTVCLWPRQPPNEPRTLRINVEPRDLAFTPDGRHLFTANEDGSIFVLRTANPK